MPLYEYTCRKCRKRFTVLVGMTAQADSEACPHCGSADAVRRVSRFARGRSDDSLDLDTADPDDPRTMRQWAKQVESELGEDLGDDFSEYVDAAEAGDDTDD